MKNTKQEVEPENHSRAGRLRLTVEVQNPNDFESIPSSQELEAWGNAAIQAASLKQDLAINYSLVIRFVDAEEGAQLNQTYRQKSTPTNVLSFPYELPDYIAELPEIKNEPTHLGDLVLCESVVKREAQEQHKSLQQHWVHLVVHGVLHLQGYDHSEDDQAQQMEALEIKILQGLGFGNPY